MIHPEELYEHDEYGLISCTECHSEIAEGRALSIGGRIVCEACVWARAPDWLASSTTSDREICEVEEALSIAVVWAKDERLASLARLKRARELKAKLFDIAGVVARAP